MCSKRILRTIIFVALSASQTLVLSAPKSHPLPTREDFEKSLEFLLNSYYDDALSKADTGTLAEDALTKSTKRVEDDEDQAGGNLYDQMQGDQPEGSEGSQEIVLNYNNGARNLSVEFIEKRDRVRKEIDERLRKENWVEYLKSNILNQIGRSNSTFAKPPDEPTLTDFNITQLFPKLFNTTVLDDDQITEKIRSFYPSCDPPANQDQDTWKDDDIMNLYFDFDHMSDNKNSNIATATLRLYRLPQNITKGASLKKDDCENLDALEEDRLLRVSVYWYTKVQKKRRGKHEVKRRLSDSKVVSETSRWVELSVKPATKAWVRAATRNLGLGVLVEDQEGKTLKTDKYFKGASCTVGVSTPKPIPTIIRDASSRQANELDRIHSLLGRNSTTTLHSDILLLPTVDICYLEFPDNYDLSYVNNARINACNLRKIHEENQRLAERERMERLATLPEFPNARHIRHQRQHRAGKMAAEGKMAAGSLESELRSRISNSEIVFTREDLEKFKKDRGVDR